MNLLFYKTARAFTLIELLVVISIIGLLSSVVLAAVSGARAKGTIAAAQTFDRHTYAALYDDSIVAWDFDRDSGTLAQDQSGNGKNLNLNSATLVNSPNPFKNGQVIRVTSDAGAASMTTNPSPIAITSDFSISFWAYKTSPSAVEYISNFSTTNGTWRISDKDNGSGLYFEVKPSGVFTQIATLTLQPNQWYQVVGVCNNNKIGLYVNGKLVSGTVILNGGVLCSFIADNIKIPGTGTTFSFSTYLDNVRIYKKALPLSLIEKLYALESQKFESLATMSMPLEKP